MKYIKLTKNKRAFIDNEDFEAVSKFKWCLMTTKRIKYAQRAITSSGKKIILLMHRIIMNPSQNMQIDHINGNGLDNRRSNLRICTRSENQRNRHTSRKTPTSLFGVTAQIYKNKIRYQAQVNINGKKVYLGMFPSELEAHRASLNKLEICNLK